MKGLGGEEAVEGEADEGPAQDAPGPLEVVEGVGVQGLVSAV